MPRNPAHRVTAHVRGPFRIERREAEQQYRRLIEGVSDYAIYSLDKGGHITSWNVGARRLSFTSSTPEGVQRSDVIFIAVPTPPQPDGAVDLSFIEAVARECRDRGIAFRTDQEAASRRTPSE